MKNSTKTLMRGTAKLLGGGVVSQTSKTMLKYASRSLDGKVLCRDKRDNMYLTIGLTAAGVIGSCAGFSISLSGVSDMSDAIMHREELDAVASTYSE